MEIQGSEQEIYMFIKSMATDRFININNIEKTHIPVEEDVRSFIIQY